MIKRYIWQGQTVDVTERGTFINGRNIPSKAAAKLRNQIKQDKLPCETLNKTIAQLWSPSN